MQHIFDLSDLLCLTVFKYIALYTLINPLDVYMMGISIQHICMSLYICVQDGYTCIMKFLISIKKILYFLQKKS